MDQVGHYEVYEEHIVDQIIEEHIVDQVGQYEVYEEHFVDQIIEEHIVVKHNIVGHNYYCGSSN